MVYGSSDVSNFATLYIVSTIETMRSSIYSRHYDELRAWLKIKREEKGLSLRSVSMQLDTHHSVVGKLEQGRRRIDVVEFVEYCHVLDIDPHEGLDIVLTSLNKEWKRSR